ncbi:anaerobic ribonucleoside-triphosphate reductase activating protein [Spirochaetia bacterium]|nr:anaerobic ribonucleoside-triphosphate reductase activating protein [Spirochaetia bacterium]
MSTKVVFRKTSLVDYPGLVSAVIFFFGCNLRCPWCHNRELVLGVTGGDSGLTTKAFYTGLEDVLLHIEKRRKVLGGVVLSGGEPTLFGGLDTLIHQIKSLGLKVKLDTNGMRPDVLEKLFSTKETRPDYIAMDLKIAPERYTELLPLNGTDAAGVGMDAASFAGEALKRSAGLIRAAGISHEFRSLSLPAPWFTETDKTALAPLAGDSPWFIRPFVPGNCLDPVWNNRGIERY